VALLNILVQELAGDTSNNASGADTGEDPREWQGGLQGNAATVCALPAIDGFCSFFTGNNEC